MYLAPSFRGIYPQSPGPVHLGRTPQRWECVAGTAAHNTVNTAHYSVSEVPRCPLLQSFFNTWPRWVPRKRWYKAHLKDFHVMTSYNYTLLLLSSGVSE